MVFSGEGLRHLVAQVGASQLMLGTDHPIPWELHPVDHVMGAPISDEDKMAILGGNAAKLFGIKANGARLRRRGRRRDHRARGGERAATARPGAALAIGRMMLSPLA